MTHVRNFLAMAEKHVIIKAYGGSSAKDTTLYQTDTIKMAGQSYFPISQSWAPGHWGAAHFILALLLCLILIGFLLFVYMLIFKPSYGTLTVTYQRSGFDKKTGPRW